MTEEQLLTKEKEVWMGFILTVAVFLVFSAYRGWEEPSGGFLLIPGIALGTAATYRHLRYRLFKKNNS